MAHILLVTLIFPPDGVSTAGIMGDLAVALRAAGHTVTVVTTTPHFNRDEHAEVRQPLRRHWGPLVWYSDFGGVPVYHVAMPRKGRSVVKRLAAWCSFHAVSTLVGALLAREVDAILAPSPPLTIGLSSWLLGVFHGAPFLYNVQEVYPDIAVKLEKLRNPLAIRLLSHLERFIYAKAAAVVVISPSIRENLLEKGVPSEKTYLIPNWVDISDLRPWPKDNDFSKSHRLGDKFVVSYAGNMGVTQRLDTILEAAALLRHRPDLRVLLVGGGTEGIPLRARASEMGLTNVIILPHQSYDLVPQIYGTSDVSVVPQAPGVEDCAIPSKVYRIMACARPVIASTHPGSDLGRLVTEAQCGRIVMSGSAQGLATAIAQAMDDPAEWAEMGRRGREHVIRHYAREIVTERYRKLIDEAVHGWGQGNAGE